MANVHSMSSYSCLIQTARSYMFSLRIWKMLGNTTLVTDAPNTRITYLHVTVTTI